MARGQSSAMAFWRICLILSFAFVIADEQTDMMNALNKFSMKFYKEVLVGRTGQNVVCSPLSADIILALFTVNVPNGDQIIPALGLNNPATTKSAYKTALTNWNAIQSGVLDIVNKIFMTNENSIKFTASFDSAAKYDFLSQIQLVNYGNQIAAQNVINTWINSKTGNNINGLSVYSDIYMTWATFVNTIFFNGNWDKKFNSAATTMTKFFRSPSQFVMRAMMRQNNVFNYASVPQWNAKIMEMTYQNGQLSIVAILPDAINGLPLTESKVFNTANINTVLDTMQMTGLNVRFPKLKIGTTVNTKTPVLTNLGIKTLFEYTSLYYYGIIEENSNNKKYLPHIKKSNQKAFIEVNEGGSKCTSASLFQLDFTFTVGKSTNSTESINTEIISNNLRSIRATQDPAFVADHPFMLILRTNDKKILFVGRYTGEDTGNIIVNDNPIGTKTFKRREVGGILVGYDVV